MKEVSVIEQANKLSAGKYNAKRGLDYLVSQLHKVKYTGHGRYIACCPAHDDRTPSLAILIVNENLV